MTFVRRVLRSRIFLRYILSYIVVLVIVFAGLSIYIIRYLDRTMERDFIESETSTLSQIRFAHESSLTGIFNMSEQFSVFDNVVPFRFTQETHKAIPLKKLLGTYRSIITFSSEQFVFFYPDDFGYTAKTSIHMDRFIDKGLIYQCITPKELSQILEKRNELTIIPSQTVSGVIIGGEYEAVSFVIPLTAGKSGGMLFIINAKQYGDMLTQHIPVVHNIYILYRGSVFVKNTIFEIPDIIVEEALEDSTADVIEHGGEKYKLVVVDGKNNMSYCTLTPMKEVAKSISAQQRNIWLFLLALIFVSIILVFVLSISGYKPVDALQTGIHDLEGKNQALIDMLNETLEYEQYNIVLQFAKGGYSSREEFLENAKRLKIDLDKEFYLISLSDSAEQDQADDFSIKKIITGDVNGCGIELVMRFQKLYILFSNSEDKLMEYITALYQSNRKRNNRFLIAASKIHTDFTQGANAYLEAVAAFDNRFLISNDEVLLFEDVQLTKDKMVYPEALINRLKGAVHTADIALVDTAIDEIFEYVKTMKPSLFSFRIFYNDIIRIVIYEQGIKKETIKKLDSYDVFTLSGCRSLEELSETLRRTCHIMFGEIDEEKETEATAAQMLIEKSKMFILKNFHDPNVNITFVADKFSINPAAFTTEFKKYTGFNPLEYLTQVRLEHAKKLLTESSLSVKDICVKSGYTDTSLFIKNFKRHMGITPAAYREWTEGRNV